MSENEKIELKPAVAAALALAPALVEACQDDPELLTALTRGQLAVVQDKMVQRALTDPEVSLSQLAAVHDALSKNAQLKKTESAGPSGQSITINFVREARNEKVVVEGQALQLPEPDAA